MSDTAVEDHYFENSSMKYFRDAAENIRLCSYGAKGTAADREHGRNPRSQPADVAVTRGARIAARV